MLEVRRVEVCSYLRRQKERRKELLGLYSRLEKMGMRLIPAQQLPTVDTIYFLATRVVCIACRIGDDAARHGLDEKERVDWMDLIALHRIGKGPESSWTKHTEA
jgi:hypothetical protein